MRLSWFWAVCALAFGASGRIAQPSRDRARSNAHQIFNEIHSAGRQWGSSINHNGMGFFPAVVPKGTLLYHGAFTNVTLDRGYEWLAFEPDHAINFAPSVRWDPSKWQSQSTASNGKARRQQTPLDKVAGGLPGKVAGGFPGVPDWLPNYPANLRGYFHVFRSARDLRLLYFDGSSAAESPYGTLDGQDLVVRGNRSAPAYAEHARAEDLCHKLQPWGFDGVVRMEMGFEIIYCDFAEGLELMSRTRTTMPSQRVDRGPGIPADSRELGVFQWARGAAQRYDGVGRSRLRIDFSSMVSGLFFFNLTSTDSDRPDLTRLASASDEELRDVKDYLQAVCARDRGHVVEWQDVVDMIVSRYADRLALLSTDSVDDVYFIEDLDATAQAYIDAAPLPDDYWIAHGVNRTADGIDRCRQHYFLPAIITRELWTSEDDLIYTAVEVVATDICVTLFRMRTLLLDAATPDGVPPQAVDQAIDVHAMSDSLRDTVEKCRVMVHDLVDRLAWPIWKKTRPCPADEVAFVAMWPFGSAGDHWEPGCRSIAEMREVAFGDGSYWPQPELPSVTRRQM